MRKFLVALVLLMVLPAFTSKAEEKEKKDENKHWVFGNGSLHGRLFFVPLRLRRLILM